MPQSSMEDQSRLSIQQSLRFRQGSQWQMLQLSQVHSESCMCDRVPFFRYYSNAYLGNGMQWHPTQDEWLYVL